MFSQNATFLKLYQKNKTGVFQQSYKGYLILWDPRKESLWHCKARNYLVKSTSTHIFCKIVEGTVSNVSSFQFTSPNQSFSKTSVSNEFLEKADTASLTSAAVCIYQLYFRRALHSSKGCQDDQAAPVLWTAHQNLLSDKPQNLKRAKRDQL